MSGDRDLLHNRAVNPSRAPAEGGRDDADEGGPQDRDNQAVNPSRPPAEGGQDEMDEAPASPRRT